MDGGANLRNPENTGNFTILYGLADDTRRRDSKGSSYSSSSSMACWCLGPLASAPGIGEAENKGQQQYLRELLTAAKGSALDADAANERALSMDYAPYLMNMARVSVGWGCKPEECGGHGKFHHPLRPRGRLQTARFQGLLSVILIHGLLVPRAFG